MRTVSRSRARLPWLMGCLTAALVTGAALSFTTVHAQVNSRATIDFAFVAGGKEMPPGAYEFEVAEWKVIVRSADGKTSGIAPVITRLGRHDTDTGTELVFDKVGGKFVLSEIWLRGVDGYLLVNTPVDHEHRVIGGSKPHQ